MLTAKYAILLVLILVSGFCDLKGTQNPQQNHLTVSLWCPFNHSQGGVGSAAKCYRPVIRAAHFFLPFAMGGMGAGDDAQIAFDGLAVHGDYGALIQCRRCDHGPD